MSGSLSIFDRLGAGPLMEQSTNMKAQLINPFISAANEVLRKEDNLKVERDGQLSLSTESLSPQDVTA